MAEVIDPKEANKALWISGAVIVLLVVGLFTNGFGLLSRSNTADAGRSNQQAGAFVKLAVNGAPTLGEVNAPVTIYEFSDFSCPYCAAAAGFNSEVIASLKEDKPLWQAPVPEIKKRYIDTGKVKLVFKYYPGHGAGNSAHLAGWCLNEQELFWQFHERAFAQQVDVGSMNAMKALAAELGADTTKLDECLSSRRYNARFQEDKSMGDSNGVRGTPAFFINGKLITGAQSFDAFESLIKRELKYNGEHK